MFKRGERVPNWTLQDHAGDTHALWDYRQKTHLVLIYDPTATLETSNRWRSAIELDRKQWDWLNAKILIIKKAPDEMAPGVYIVDRYGLFMTYFSLERWSFDELEKEFVYYEAKHC